MGQYKAPRPGSKWYLPYEVYRTVVNYCYCYRRWKHASAATGVSAVAYDGMPHGSNVSDPTEAAVMRLSGALARCRIIEETVREVDEGLYPWLLLGVTDPRASYNWLRTRKGMPCGHGMFTDRKRQVYYLMADRI